jgi:hypothetical protein
MFARFLRDCLLEKRVAICSKLYIISIVDTSGLRPTNDTALFWAATILLCAYLVDNHHALNWVLMVSFVGWFGVIDLVPRCTPVFYRRRARDYLRFSPPST